MNKIPTAEEYLISKGMNNVGHYGLLITDPSKQKMHQIMEDYAKIKAKFYVEAALKAASENAFITNHKPTLDDDRFYKKIDKNSILNAYPLENVK